jgi:membrane protein required for colicin V production
MTSADYVILFLCLASALIGLWRGFTAEALSLLTLLVSIWLAWAFAPSFEAMLGNWVGASPEVRLWAARVVVFVLALLVGGLISWLARKLIRHTGLSGLDRVLGAGFGVLRAVVLIGLAVIVMEFLGLQQEAWWQQSQLKPYADRAADAVKYYAELGNRYLQNLKERPAASA